MTLYDKAVGLNNFSLIHSTPQTNEKREIVFGESQFQEKLFITSTFLGEAAVPNRIGGDFTADFAVPDSCQTIVRQIVTNDDIEPAVNVPSLIQTQTRTQGDQIKLTKSWTFAPSETSTFAPSVIDFTLLYYLRNVDRTMFSHLNTSGYTYQCSASIGNPINEQTSSLAGVYTPFFFARFTDNFDGGTTVAAHVQQLSPNPWIGPVNNFPIISDDLYFFVRKGSLIASNNDVLYTKDDVSISNWTYNNSQIETYNIHDPDGLNIFVCNFAQYNDYMANAWSNFGLKDGLMYFSTIDLFTGKSIDPSYYNDQSTNSTPSLQMVQILIGAELNRLRRFYPADSRLQTITVDYVLSLIRQFNAYNRPQYLLSFDNDDLKHPYMVYNVKTITKPDVQTICRPCFTTDVTFSLKNFFLRSPNVSLIFIGRTEDNILGSYFANVVDVVDSSTSLQFLNVNFVENYPPQPLIYGLIPTGTRKLSNLVILVSTLNGQPYPFSTGSNVLIQVNLQRLPARLIEPSRLK